MIGFLLRSSRFVFVLSVCAGLCSGLGGVGLIAVINTALGWERDVGSDLGRMFVALCVLLILARAASAFLLMRLGQNVVIDLRLRLSRQILSAPYNRLQELGAARILATLTEDITTLSEAFRWLPMLCVNTAVVVGCLMYLGWLSYPLLAVVAISIVIGITVFRLVKRSALNNLKIAREFDDKLYGHLRSLTQGIKELKLHQARRNDFLEECLEATSFAHRKRYLSGMGFYILAGNWGTGLFYVVIGIILFVVPMWQGNTSAWGYSLPVLNNLSSDILRGYCLTILFMMSPLNSLLEGMPVWGRAKVALKKINRLSEEAQEFGAKKFSRPPSQFSSSSKLEMVGVTHRYRVATNEAFMLGPVDFELTAGELVFVIGGNGSGKTTLSLLLVGLYAPEKGELKLDGRVITDESRDEYRQLFSAVFSDFYLFDSLLGFDRDELDEEAREFLVRLQLEHKVSIENGAFSTLSLSQGQRKRLALLVAYLEDRPFYLFDEWAADQDPVFKKIFYRELLPSLKAKGKTIVVVTHDDAYFDVADRCLKIEDGKLIEVSSATLKREIGPDNVVVNKKEPIDIEILS